MAHPRFGAVNLISDPVHPGGEHSRLVRGLGVMNQAGLWGRVLYPTRREQS